MSSHHGFLKLEAETLADKAFESIETAIVTGKLLPGAKITEALLARTFGISRGPLREAIRRLEGRKLVTRIPHIGPSVASWSRQDLIEVFLVREALEGMACRLATEHMSEGELAELDDVLEQHRHDDRLRAGASYYQVAGDLDFHYRVARGSRNAKLIELLCGELYSVLRVHRYRSGATPGRARQAFEEHQRIVAAMRARKPDLAETLMREHIAYARLILSRAGD